MYSIPYFSKYLYLNDLTLIARQLSEGQWLCFFTYKSGLTESKQRGQIIGKSGTQIQDFWVQAWRFSCGYHARKELLSLLPYNHYGTLIPYTFQVGSDKGKSAWWESHAGNKDKQWHCWIGSKHSIGHSCLLVIHQLGKVWWSVWLIPDWETNWHASTFVWISLGHLKSNSSWLDIFVLFVSEGRNHKQKLPKTEWEVNQVCER